MTEKNTPVTAERFIYLSNDLIYCALGLIRKFEFRKTPLSRLEDAKISNSDKSIIFLNLKFYISGGGFLQKIHEIQPLSHFTPTSKIFHANATDADGSSHFDVSVVFLLSQMNVLNDREGKIKVIHSICMHSQKFVTKFVDTFFSKICFLFKIII